MAPSKVEKTPNGTPVEGEQSMAGVSATQQAAPAPEPPPAPPPAPQSDAEKFASRVARKLAKLVPDGVTVEADGERIKATNRSNVRGLSPAYLGLTGNDPDVAASQAEADLRKYWGI